MSEISPAGPSPEATPAPSLSLVQRAIAVFTRPTQAWSGLERRAQWWFPMLLVLAVSVAGSIVLHDRALMPMLTETWEDQVAEGQMSAESMDGALQFMSGPIGMTTTTVQQAIVIFLLVLLFGGAIWFAVGFLLGAKISFRLGLEVSAWASLVTIPATLVTYALAWVRESYKGLHVGLGALLPEPETPSKLMTGLATFLDAFGPLQVWHLVVTILGAAAVSRAPVKRVGWTLAILYLVLSAVLAAMAAMFTPGA